MRARIFVVALATLVVLAQGAVAGEGQRRAQGSYGLSGSAAARRRGERGGHPRAKQLNHGVRCLACAVHSLVLVSPTLPTLGSVSAARVNMLLIPSYDER